jgi:hypothetical protein
MAFKILIKKHASFLSGCNMAGNTLCFGAGEVIAGGNNCSLGTLPYRFIFTDQVGSQDNEC